MELIQQFQITALRFIYELRGYDYVSTFRNATDIDANGGSLQSTDMLLVVHRVIIVEQPHYLVDRIQSRVGVAQRDTRQDGRPTPLPKGQA